MQYIYKIFQYVFLTVLLAYTQPTFIVGSQVSIHSLNDKSKTEEEILDSLQKSEIYLLISIRILRL